MNKKLEFWASEALTVVSRFNISHLVRSTEATLRVLIN